MKSIPSDRSNRRPPALRSHSLETLEARISPAALVSSILRAGGALPDTSAGSVSYTVTFSEAVTGVDASDFIVHTEGNAHASSLVTVTPVSASVYTVMAGGLHGQGEVRLDLVDNDTIVGGTGVLGGAGAKNGSYQGAAYHLLQTFPKVNSIVTNGSATTAANSVSWTVTLSAPVTGVDSSDFTLIKGAGVSADAAVAVTPVSSTVYTVTASGVSGSGSLALRLVDDGTIKDASGNPLQGSGATFGLQTPVATGAGSSPRFVAVADLNGDGRADLVSANQGASTASIFLGNGSGGFTAQPTVATGTSPRAVAVADVNGDGIPDLLTANGNANTMSVLLGNGTGGFTALAPVGTGPGPVALAVGDVNGDGKVDVVTANIGSGANSVSVLLGNGAGVFSPQATLSTDTNPAAIALGDVNLDGKLDVVTADAGAGNLNVFLGNGNGSFGTKNAVSAGTTPTSVVVTDVNGDGKPDLLGLNGNSRSVSVLLGNGAGGFAAQAGPATGTIPYSIAAGDVDGDGRPDLLTANFGVNTVSILQGNGSGGFTPQLPVSTGAGSQPGTVSVGDVNGDGRLDFVTSNLASDNLSVVLGNGDGSLTGAPFTIAPPPAVSSIVRTGPDQVTGASASWTVTFSGSVTGVDPADFVAVTGEATKAGAISVSGSGAVYTVTVDGLRGSGDVWLSLVDNDSIVSSLAPLGGSGIANGSFQGDVIHLRQTSPTVLSITPNGNTSTAGAGSVAWTVTLSAPVTGVDANDFSLVDSGVNPDAAVTVSGSGAVYTVTATGLRGAGHLALTLADNGSIVDANGNHLQATTTPSFTADGAGVTTLVGAADLVLADVNSDGRLDAVVGGSGGISVRFGTAGGTLAAGSTSGSFTGVTSLAVGDLDGDGKPDVLAASASNHQVAVLLGDGSGGFTLKTSFAINSPRDVTLADLNRDGRLDLLVSNGASSLSVLLNTGNGTFAPKADYATGSGPAAIAVGDLNLDGKLDAVTANFDGGNISLLFGNGAGQFLAAQNSSQGASPSAVVIADLNGDGKPDIALAQQGSRNVLVLLGDGHGAFTVDAAYGTGDGPLSLVVADLNRDGFRDLVYTTDSIGSSKAGVLYGTGTGSFAKADLFVGSDPKVLLAHDLDGSGVPSLVVLNPSGTRIDTYVDSARASLIGAAFTVTLPSVTLAIGSASSTEGDAASLTYTFSRGGDVGAPLTVHFTTSGTASFATDYAAFANGTLDLAHGELTIPAGQSSATITLVPVDDRSVEGSETVVLALAADPAYASAGGAATGTILDNDTATIGFVATTSQAAEGEFGQGIAVVLTINATGNTGVANLARDVTYGLTTAGGTALAGADYSVSGIGIFAASLQSGAVQSFTVTPVNDGLVEPIETAVVAVQIGQDGTGGQVASATGAAATHTVFIADNDTPSIAIAHASVWEGNAATTNLDFTVTLSTPSYFPVTVRYSTADGTALAPGDYAAQRGALLTFAPGETTKTISVPVFGDLLYEGGIDETFTVHLDDPTNAAIGQASALGQIISDDGLPMLSVPLDKTHPYTFTDTDNDKVIVKLTGPGTGAVLRNGQNGISALVLQGTTLASALSVTVVKGTNGNGAVNLGEVITDGSLGSFTAPAADLLEGGFRAAGAVKTISVRDLLHGEIITAGTPAAKLALTLRDAAGGTLLQHGETVTLTARQLGAGSVQAAAFTALNVTAGPLAAEVTSAGAIAKIAVKGGGLSGDLTAASFGAVTITGGSFTGSLISTAPSSAVKALTSLAVTTGSLSGDVTLVGASGAITVKGGSLGGHLTAESFGAVSITGGDFSGSLTSTAPLDLAKALTSLAVTTGSLTGDVTLAGAIGAVTVKGGGLSGHLTASSFGAVSVAGGDFSGSLVSLTPRLTLGAAKALTSLTVTDGNLTGDVRLLGASGAITVKSKPALGRGDVINASIVASAIASLTVGRDFIGSIVLAGADLGADHDFGGVDNIFAAGTIGAVKIGRNVGGLGTIIGAGFSTPDSELKNANDAVVGGVASYIASLTVTGTADDDSYFAAGLFKTAPKIAGAVATPATDGRFKVG